MGRFSVPVSGNHIYSISDESAKNVSWKTKTICISVFFLYHDAVCKVCACSDADACHRKSVQSHWNRSDSDLRFPDSVSLFL